MMLNVSLILPRGIGPFQLQVTTETRRNAKELMYQTQRKNLSNKKSVVFLYVAFPSRVTGFSHYWTSTSKDLFSVLQIFKKSRLALF